MKIRQIFLLPRCVLRHKLMNLDLLQSWLRAITHKIVANFCARGSTLGGSCAAKTTKGQFI
jgi:hypothetical protein